MDIEALKIAIKESFSIAQTLKKLGYAPFGANYKKFHQMVKKHGLDTSHFTGMGHLKNKTHNFNTKMSLEEILVENSEYLGGTSKIKKRLLKEKIFEDKCFICGVFEWKNKPLSLHLDHVNGINDDNRIENLRLLCPNCHSQTSTYAGKNKKKMLGTGLEPVCPKGESF